MKGYKRKLREPLPWGSRSLGPSEDHWHFEDGHYHRVYYADSERHAELIDRHAGVYVFPWRMAYPGLEPPRKRRRVYQPYRVEDSLLHRLPAAVLDKIMDYFRWTSTSFMSSDSFEYMSWRIKQRIKERIEDPLVPLFEDQT